MKATAVVAAAPLEGDNLEKAYDTSHLIGLSPAEALKAIVTTKRTRGTGPKPGKAKPVGAASATAHHDDDDDAFVTNPTYAQVSRGGMREV